MKTKKIAISILLVLAMVLGLLAVMPFAASAKSITPTPQETLAEKIYVGGVELGLGQYVMNGTDTAVMGDPAIDASGYAHYTLDGQLFLVDYEYEGTGYTHDTSEKSVIYSTGKLEVILYGNSSIKNTADAAIWSANGIRAKGNLIVNGPGAITINAPYAIYGDALVKIEYGKTVIPSATVAIEAGGNFILAGGILELHSVQPILSGANFISGGLFFATAEQGVFKTAPTISVNTEDEYYMVICSDVEGNNPAAYVPENITQYKYFKIVPPERTEIDSISVSGVTIPVIGDVMAGANYEDAICSESYHIEGMYLETYIDGVWVKEQETVSIVAGKQYRAILWIEPEEGYSFPADISNENITLNGKEAKVYEISKHPFYNAVKIAYEFSYDAPSTPITSISVSGADLPEVGETKDAMEFTPDTLTYGGEYKMVGRGFHKYTGTEWVDVSDTESLEYGVKYRVNLVLAPNEGYAFADSITSDDVTFNGEAGIFETLISGVGYASILYEFSYEAPATDYGIKIADTNDSGETIGVIITEENYTDVLGDGTVSYDPTTKTLTLNGYIYAGAGFDEDVAGAILIDLPEDGMTINLMGENKISVASTSGAGFATFGDGNVTIKGSGSLEMQVGMYGFMMTGDVLTVDGGNITIKTTGTPSAGLAVNNFIMNGGNLEIDSVFLGIVTMNSANAVIINGGSLEIGVLSEGYTVAYSTGEMVFESKALDLSGYDGAFKMIAGASPDGTGAGVYSEEQLGSYKYIKITKTESYGITIADKDDSGETVGVLITKENYTDVLGDGTVSYDPTTNTLTLNGYKYEGSGFGDDTKYGILVESIGALNIVLKGENIIDVTNTGILERMRRPSIGISTWETNVAISGDGSLIISATDGGLYIYGEEGNPSLEIKGGTVTVNAPWGIGTASFKMSGGNLTVNAQEADGDIASAICPYEFIMTGGNLKITSAGLGVEMWHDSHEDAPPMISGGSLDISVAVAGGAFCYYNYADDVCVAIAPDLTNYTGAHKLTAGASADGTGAGDYNASDIATYKYIKLEPVHTHAAGTEIKSDANNHWNECECGEKLNVSAHADGTGDGKCDACNYQMTPVAPDPDPTPDTDPDDTTPPADDKNDDNGGKKKLSGGAIAGIVIGSTVGVCVVGVGIFSLIWFVIKKKSFSDLLMVFRK